MIKECQKHALGVTDVLGKTGIIVKSQLLNRQGKCWNIKDTESEVIE